MAIKGEKRRLGFFGERKAARYLRKNGYKILRRNFKTKLGEVDIITEKGEYVCFIEVKTRRTHTYGEPNEAVGSERRSRYKNTANLYFYRNGLNQADYIIRFDVIEITPDGINHIENAF